jgi:hypothetical protein
LRTVRLRALAVAFDQPELVRLPSQPSEMTSCSPTLGHHAASILRELGRTDAEIANIMSQEVIRG